MWNPVKLVENAAIVLDQRKKKWHEKIDLAKLDQANLRHSILGQLYGHHDTGMLALLQAGEGAHIRLAFIPPGYLRSKEVFRWLTVLWAMEVEKRCK
jgi:hypothetical protein